MQTVTDNMRLPGAYHQALTALRHGRNGNEAEKNAAVGRMYDTLEACEYPYFTTSRLIKQLGRPKSLVLGLSRPLINLALKMEWN